MPSGDVTFDGINFPRYMTACRTWGCNPDNAIILAHSQDSPPMAVGTLAFSFNGQGVTWTNALCDQMTTQRSTHGWMTYYVIQDRRWRWSKGIITGAYNLRDEEGVLDPTTEKTLAELATLLFTEMGEPGASVSAISSSEKPTVIWDRDNAVHELEQLLYQRGYVPTLSLDDQAVVYAVGSGATLPNNDDVFSVSNTIDPPELPYILKLVMAQTRVQSKLKCCAVGLDTDGAIKKVDDLSYRPTGGWGDIAFGELAEITDPEAHQCALLSVGKWFQIEFQADGTHDLSPYLPDEITVTSAKQYLPVYDELIQTKDDIFTTKRVSPAIVEATYFNDQGVTPTGKNVTELTRMNRTLWTLDRQRGIVKFVGPLKKRADNGEMTFADVYLTCSYSVLEDDTHVYDKHERDRNMGGTGTDVVKVEELRRTLIADYDADGTTLLSLTDNQTTVDADADLYLDQAALRYVTEIGNVVAYRGIYPFGTDGITQQVRWNAAKPGTEWAFSTTCSLHCEGIVNLPRRARRAQKRATNRNDVASENRLRQRQHIRKGGR